MKRKMFFIVKTVITVIVLGVWSIVGLFFWIPLLSRVILIYTISVAEATFSRRDVGPAGEMLDKATTFYIYGFSTIWSHTFGMSKNAEESINTVNRVKTTHTMMDDSSLRRVATEAAYSVVFYASIFLLRYFSL
jgi:hypothetical protein